MKNLREEDMFAELKQRLQEYTEDPDSGAWDKIAGALPSQNTFSRGIIIDHVVGSGILLLLLLQFLIVDPATKRHRSNDGQFSQRTPSLASRPAEKYRNENPRAEELSSTLESVMERSDLTLRSLLDGPAQTTRHQLAMAARRKEKALSIIPEQQLFDESQDEQSRNDDRPGTIGAKTTVAIDAVDDGNYQEMSTSAPAEHCEDKRDSAEHLRPKERPETRLKKDQKKPYRATIYGSMTTSFAYQNVVPSRNDDVTVNGLKSVSIFDPTRIGIQLEAGYQRQLSKRFDVYAGVVYYRQHQRIGFYQSAEAAVTSTGDLNFTVHPSEQTGEVNYFMQNIGAAAGFFYLIRDGKLQHKAGVGLQYQAGLKSGDQTYDNRASTYLNYQLAYRLQLQLSEHQALFVQPSFNHVLYANEVLREPFGIKSYRAGIGVGLLWKL